jgi:hypothetical protein
MGENVVGSRPIPTKHWLINQWWSLPPDERGAAYWTTAQVAHRLGITEGRVRALADEGKDEFPAIKPLGRILIHVPSLRLWLDRRER